ncbi:MAG: GTPase Era [Bacteriovoracaceae bacterium]|nr:GTPase Era [Bacteriovoracaceae bacterium]
MLFESQHPLNKSIVVAVLGKPNAGKSSLVNALMGVDLSVVTSKAQTTRHKFHCVFTIDHTEVVLVDTPGIHSSTQELNLRMMGQVEEGAQGAELNLILMDTEVSLQGQWQEIVKEFPKGDGLLNKSWMIFTKKDVARMSIEDMRNFFEEIKKEYPFFEKFFVTSSKTEEGINDLTQSLCDMAGPNLHRYPGGEMSNKNMRFFVTEYIRGVAFELLKEELPYELAVTIENYEEAPKSGDIVAAISAVILVNRPSQRAIVIGKGGQMIRDIGSLARKKIETLIGGKVFLGLHVKVSPNWFKNNFVLEELGLPRVQSSHRIWRKKV